MYQCKYSTSHQTAAAGAIPALLHKLVFQNSKSPISAKGPQHTVSLWVWLSCRSIPMTQWLLGRVHWILTFRAHFLTYPLFWDEKALWKWDFSRHFLLLYTAATLHYKWSVGVVEHFTRAEKLHFQSNKNKWQSFVIMPVIFLQGHFQGLWCNFNLFAWLWSVIGDFINQQFVDLTVPFSPLQANFIDRTYIHSRRLNIMKISKNDRMLIVIIFCFILSLSLDA